MYLDIREPADFVARCRALRVKPDEYLLICIARCHQPELDGIIDALAAAGIRFFGAVFPALVHGGLVVEKGAVVQAHPLLAPPAVARIDGDKISWTSPLPETAAARGKPTCFVLADFSCVAVTTLLLELFNRHGNEMNYFGAGAGNGDRTPNPVVFSNEGRFVGSALVAYIERPSVVGLRHGWTRRAGPLVATRTEGNLIKELNWEPAMDVYRAQVGDEVADSLGRKEDVPAAKRYPLGIAREDIEDVVRDPLLGTDNSELMVLSDVPENSVMHVLYGDPDNLIAAAGRLGADFTAENASANCLVFDCYSRSMLLGPDILKEIQTFEGGLRSNSITCDVEGALALGEIASDGNRLPDFHNKTIAAMLFN